MNKKTDFQITVSIVLYKTDVDRLNDLIGIIQSNQLNILLILIDNSPSDTLRHRIKSEEAIYIFTGQNLGYGKGHNIAIKESLNRNVKYHLVLNPDVEFDKYALTEIYQYMENNVDVAQVMPKVVYPSGEIQYLCKLLPTPADLIIRRFLPRSFFKRSSDKYELRFTGYNKLMNIPYLSGCFMFLRCAALIEIGLFDERFFMYPEDIDLTRRLYKKFRTIYYPKVQIVHGHEKGSYKTPLLLCIHVINMIKYFNKWGWFIDAERKAINKKVFKELKKENKLLTKNVSDLIG